MKTHQHFDPSFIQGLHEPANDKARLRSHLGVCRLWILVSLLASLACSSLAADSNELIRAAETEIKFATLVLFAAEKPNVKYCPLRIKLAAKEYPLGTTPVGGIPECTIQIRNAAGEKCPYTEYGKGRINRKEFTESMLDEIEARDSRVYLLRLEKYFALTPGKWTIDFEMKVTVWDLEQPGRTVRRTVEVPRITMMVE